MIKEADIGNSTTKDSIGNIFDSKVSIIPNALGDKHFFELDGERYFVGKGEFDTEYRKVYKKSYFKLLYALLCMSSNDLTNEINLVVGLPLSQYSKDRENLKEIILNKYILSGQYDECEKNFIINDCEVYLEGVASLPSDYEGVFIDIGGRTTDAGIIYIENGKRKITNAYSQAKGMINLYSDFIKVINFKYGLDLNINDANRIIQKGLKIKNKSIDISNELNIFKEFLDGLVSDLNVQYSLDTNRVTFTGGGSLTLATSIKNRIEHAEVLLDGVFSNAKGFNKYGRSIWNA